MRKKVLFSGCFLGVILILLAFLTFFFVQAQKEESQTSSVMATSSAINTRSSQETEVLLEGQVGWLKVDGTDIDDAVMQAEDNDYYLRRNEYGKDDIWGCFFMDYDCTAASQNIIIYGHSLDDNPNDKRFSQLKRLSDPEFATQHHTIELNYNGETLCYEVVSAGTANISETTAMISNPSADQMNEVIDDALKRSDVPFEMASLIDRSSRILTLVTCTSNSSERYIVTAVLVAKK